MPPSAIRCTCRPLNPFTLEDGLAHWKARECPNPPGDELWCADIVQHQVDDVDHADLKVSPTRVLDCPRAQVIRDLMPYFMDPRDHHTAHWSTKGLHEAAAPNREGFDNLRVLGVTIRGVADWIAPDHHWIHDLKGHGDRSMEWKVNNRKLIDDELVVQLNLYRLGYEAAWGTPGVVRRLTAWHTSSGYKGMGERVEVPIRDEAWIARVRPYGAQMTTAEIAGWYRKAQELREAGLSPEEIVAEIPLVGRDMFPDKQGRGQKCTKYCAQGIKAHCDRIAGVGGGGSGW